MVFYHFDLKILRRSDIGKFTLANRPANLKRTPRHLKAVPGEFTTHAAHPFSRIRDSRGDTFEKGDEKWFLHISSKIQKWGTGPPGRPNDVENGHTKIFGCPLGYFGRFCLVGLSPRRLFFLLGPCKNSGSTSEWGKRSMWTTLTSQRILAEIRNRQVHVGESPCKP